MNATTLRLALSGLWFRRSTTLIVLVLATVASAASVIAPLYSRAAEESILRDTVSRTDASTRSVQVTVPTAGGGPLREYTGEFATGVATKVLTHPAFGKPRLAYAKDATIVPPSGEFKDGLVATQVVDRVGICAHLPTTEGRCPQAAGEAMVSGRSLALAGVGIGDPVEVTPKDSGISTDIASLPRVVTATVVGTYDPVPTDSAYWAGRPYFDSYYPRVVVFGLGDERPATLDPVFVGPGTAKQANITDYTVDVPVDPAKVRLADTATLRKQVEALTLKNSKYFLSTYSQLPAALGRADDGRDLVRIAAPLAVTQLVLLSWWTLYLVVGSATEERSPELGLAKLRGLTARQTRRFGLAEVFLLLLVAAPLGTLIGYLGVRGAADRVFAPGTEVRLTWSVLLTVIGALLGGVVTAGLASRAVFRRPVSDLLRRVPPRHAGRRAGLLEGVVIVLALAGVVQLVNDRGGRPSPIALLGPGMIAVAGGLLAARMLVRLARRRTTSSLARGRASGAVGWAGLARRPGTARIASVLAVATCLLIVSVQAWTVAERNRGERARGESGAEVVLHVQGGNPHALLESVRAADPGGRYAMAVVAVTSSTQEPDLLAVDSTRADEVLEWGAPGDRPVGGVRGALRPPLPDPLQLGAGRLEVAVDLREVDSPSPLHLTARVTRGATTTRVALGSLRGGAHTYTAALPDSCARGCRLAAIAVDHAATDLDNATATLLLRSISLQSPGSGSIMSVVDSFGRPDAWRATGPSIGGAELVLRPGNALRIQLRTPGGLFAEAVHGDSPEPLPAVAGSAAARTAAGENGVRVAETTGLSGTTTRFATTHRSDHVPRAGRNAALVDLGLALQLSDETPVGTREVWLARDDRPAEKALRAELKDHGMTIVGRDTRGGLERIYAGDGAVLALRLLLVCGAAAVVVAVGALLVAAYVGRRQRAYEVAAMRVVGMRRRTVRTLLLRENVGTVVVALACGAAAAVIATWVVLPALPQFDQPSEFVDVRYSPDVLAAWAAVGGLALLLVTVGLVVATLQLRTGRFDRLREGVR